MPGIRRKFTGPNGQDNYIPDNVRIVLTRNPATHITQLDAYGPNGEHFQRVITRLPSELVSGVGFWVQI